MSDAHAEIKIIFHHLVENSPFHAHVTLSDQCTLCSLLLQKFKA